MKYVALTFSILLASHDLDGVKVYGWNVFEKQADY
jgi:hypothetical protein